MSNNPSHAWQYALAEVAMKSLNLAAVRVVAPTDTDLEPAFATMKKENCDALLVLWRCDETVDCNLGRRVQESR